MKNAPDLPRLAAAYEYVADVVASHPDGHKALPLFERLEREMEAVQAQDSAIDRARRIAQERAERARA